MSGFTKVPEHRSLLDNRVGYVTLRCMGKPGRLQSRSVISQLVRDILGAEGITNVSPREYLVITILFTSCTSADKSLSFIE